MKSTSGNRFRAGLLCAALSVLSAASLKADPFAYMAGGDGAFGTINLQTGAYTSLGNSGQTLFGLGVANGLLFGTAYETAGALYSVDTATGHLTLVGTADGVNYWAFGSTLAGLYGIDEVSKDLYSVNASTGAATRIGNTGITDFADWSQFSTNAGDLYFGNGSQLYSISTTSGVATLIGGTGGPHIGALLYQDGILYGGQNPSGCEQNCEPCPDGICEPPCEQNCEQPPCEFDCPILDDTLDPPGQFNIITLNTNTGVATIQAAVTGTPDLFFALAPTDLGSVATPEPSSGLLLGGTFVALMLVLRRKARA